MFCSECPEGDHVVRTPCFRSGDQLKMSQLRFLLYIPIFDNGKELHFLRWVLPRNEIFYLHICIYWMISETFELPTHRGDLSMLKVVAKIPGKTWVFLGKNIINNIVMDILLLQDTEKLILITATLVVVIDSLTLLGNIDRIVHRNDYLLAKKYPAKHYRSRARGNKDLQ